MNVLEERPFPALAAGMLPVRTGARILLVDEDDRNLLALSEALADVGEVVIASSGHEAVGLVQTENFPVILIDVSTPAVNGYEIASLIRERDQSARTPIIFLSTIDMDSAHQMRGYAMGTADYVFKPVEPIVLKAKVGVFVDLHTMRSQVTARNGAGQGLSGSPLRDAIEHLQIHTELQASQARLAGTLDALPLLLYEAQADAAGRLTRCFVGGDLSRISGAQEAAFDSGARGWEDRIHPDDRTRIPLLNQVDPPVTVSFEYRWLCGEGKTRHFIEQCVPLPENLGSRRWAGTLIDVTEQKQLEAQLHQAGKMDAIGQLTGGIAHDFNNLLATMLGGLQLLQRRTQFAEREQLIVDHMRQAAEKGAELVKRMMAFARKQDLHPVSIDPAALRESVGGLLETTLGGTIALDWNVAASGRNFFADPSQLELALVNLVLNARDAMPGGGRVRIEIADAPRERVFLAGLPEGPYLAIRVMDDGIGIPPELLDRILEPFYTTKQLGKGTGLGLSMTVGFVQQSGGKLTIDSIVGKGTSVEILLPSTTSPAAAGIHALGPEVTMDLAVRSVLLVDDDEMVRSVMAEQLRELGLDVTVAADGASALNLLKNGKLGFDLIVSDFAMPGLNGMQTIAEARIVRPELRAVIMTGYMDDSPKRHGATDVAVLRKPVRMDELIKVLV